MINNVSLEELQIAVNSFDSSASVGDLIFNGFCYSEKQDFYKVFMFDVRRGKRYIVAFRRGKFVAVVGKS